MLTHDTLRQNILLLRIIINLELKYLKQKTKEKGLNDKSSISNLIQNYDLNTKLAILATKQD